MAPKNVLLKEPKGREVNDDDVFSVNNAFTSKSIKVKLSAVSSQKETEAENIETRQKVTTRDFWAGACMWYQVLACRL